MRWLLLLVSVLTVSSRLNLNNGLFAQVTPNAQMPPTGSTTHTATSIGGDGFIVGGDIDQTTGDAYSDTQKYNPQTNQWIKLPNGRVPDSFAASDLVAVGGLLYMLGGKSGTTGSYINDLFMLNPSNPQATWQNITTDNSLPERNGHTCTAVAGSLYVFGGWNETMYFSDLWIYDVSALYLQGEAIWLQSNSIGPSARDGHSAVAYSGSLYIFGGFWHDVSYGPYISCATEPCIWFNDLWVFTTMASKWTQVYPGPVGVLPPPRYGHVAEVVGENMYVFGGAGVTAALNDMWAYSFAFNIWQQLQPAGTLPSPRWNSASWVIGESIFIFGGDSGADLDLWAFYPHVNPDTVVVDDSSSTNVEGLEAAVSLNIILTFALGILAFLIYREQSSGPSSSASTTTTVYS